jgi:hypothetical protein
MARSLQTSAPDRTMVPTIAELPRELRVDMEHLARRHDRSLSAEVRRALGFYVRAMAKREEAG